MEVFLPDINELGEPTAALATEYTVSGIARAIKNTIEQSFSKVRVKGEISGARYADSGHVYFSLKDEQAVLHAICWKGVAGRLPFKLEDGLEVVCTGAISTYPGRSVYQITVERVEVAGVGALLKMLEQRKKQLAAEGLFDPARKKPLPYMPQVIGVITSPSGAVIRDILHRIHERYPVHVLVWGVLVQGPDAAAQVARAIDGFHDLPSHIPTPDLLIVARGGGSVEDIWPFNEEIVARTVARARIPIISAIGHETDTTLIDFVSDRRAPTPTAAAEIAVPVKRDLQQNLIIIGTRLNTALPNLVSQRDAALQSAIQGFHSSARSIARLQAQMDQLTLRLLHGLQTLYSSRSQLFVATAAKLQWQQLYALFETRQLSFIRMQGNMQHIIQKIVTRCETSLILSSKLLESYHYHKTLARGFAVVRDRSSKLVRSATAAIQAAKVNLEFYDGGCDAIIQTKDALISKPQDKIIAPKKQRQKSDADLSTTQQLQLL